MSAPPELPDVVSRAFGVSRTRGYVSFCRNETGRLLASLAASRQGTLAEFGTGCGVGTAWLRSGMRAGTRIVTAELDPETMLVHGIDGLRVVDASSMPYVTNGNIYAPVMMLAEKAADLILGNTPLPALDAPYYRHRDGTPLYPPGDPRNREERP